MKFKSILLIIDVMALAGYTSKGNNYSSSGNITHSNESSSKSEESSSSGKSSNTNSSSENDGYLRSETSFNLEDKYTSRIVKEIYTHMFEFSDYEYNSYDGCYRYYASSFTAAVEFQDGYLTYLYYILGMNFFEINASFETTIDIPKSYYYK